MFRCPKRQAGESFRVGIHDSAGSFRLKLEGRLAAAEAREVESCWITARSTIGDKRFLVDLSLTTAVDSAGRALLERLYENNAQFVVATPEMARLASGITGAHPSAAAGPRERRDSLRAWSDFAELVACLFARWKVRAS